MFGMYTKAKQKYTQWFRDPLFGINLENTHTHTHLHINIYNRSTHNTLNPRRNQEILEIILTIMKKDELLSYTVA